MFFSRWTLCQGMIITLLAVIAYTAETFNTEISGLLTYNEGTITPMFMILLFIVVVIGLLSLLMYFQTKKSDTFLKHPLWDKMHILMSFLLLISLVVIFSVFMIDPLNNLVQNNRWLLYVCIYYVLFLLNVIVLAIIHKVKKHTISNENKIKFSFVWTTLALFFIFFML